MNDKELNLVIEAARQAGVLMPALGSTDENEDEEIKMAINKAFVAGAAYAKDHP